MGKKEGFLWGILAGVLVILYLLSSTDFIIKERKTEIYPVSIVIGDTLDEYYVNFRKGVEQAADEYNADVSFITLFDKEDAAQQLELVGREMEDGAKAVILEPLDMAACIGALEKNMPASPLILMEGTSAGEQARCSISPDYFEQGEKLGTAILSEHAEEIPIYVFTEKLKSGRTKEMYEGLLSVLSGRGGLVTLVEEEAEDTFRRVIETTVYPGSGLAVIAALDARSTDKAAEIISGSPVYGRYITGLYGTGTTPAILNQMDKGIIKGLVISNEFEQGYLCVENAVQAIEKKKNTESIRLESYYIEKADLRDRFIEKTLYPIE